MSARVTTAIEPDGRVVACKRSRDADDAARLAHEAMVLSRAEHPGVVELVRAEEDEHGVELVTEFVGSHSLDTAGRVPLERAAGIVAALAETVADLHELGLVHGRIDPTHVLLGAGGRPILCGFGGGGPVDTIALSGSAPLPGFADDATDGQPLAPARDLFGLGALLSALVADSGADLEPIPDRRYTLSRLRPLWSGYQRRALLTLADRATDDEPLRRPSARRLAADIHDSVPGACLDVEDPFAALRPANEPAPAAGVRRGRLFALVATAMGLVLVFLGATGLRGSGSVAEPLPPTSRPPSSVVTVTSVVTPSTSPLPTGCTVTAGPVAVDVDGDGCADPVSVAADGMVTIGRQRFAVGDPGDRVAVGDWDCDGVATAAVLRPSSGAVFVFTEWDAQHDVVATPTTTVADAVDVHATTAADGCATLVVVRGDGTEIEVPQ
jgi:hypothetical protein